MGNVLRAFAITWIDKSYIVVVTFEEWYPPEDDTKPTDGHYGFLITDPILGTVLYEHDKLYLNDENAINEPMCAALSRLYRSHILGV